MSPLDGHWPRKNQRPRTQLLRKRSPFLNPMSTQLSRKSLLLILRLLILSLLQQPSKKRAKRRSTIAGINSFHQWMQKIMKRLKGSHLKSNKSMLSSTETLLVPCPRPRNNLYINSQLQSNKTRLLKFLPQPSLCSNRRPRLKPPWRHQQQPPCCHQLPPQSHKYQLKVKNLS